MTKIVREEVRQMDARDVPPAGPVLDVSADVSADGLAGVSAGVEQGWDPYQAWFDREVAAGRDPEEVHALYLPDDDEAEQEPPDDDDYPGPALLSSGDPADDLAGLSDRGLIEFMQARARRIAQEQYEVVQATALYAQRQRHKNEAALARGVPAGCAPGGFPGDELAAELVISRLEAGHRIDDAVDLTTRLPATLAGMAAGDIDVERAGWIAVYTRSLSLQDAATADQVLAADAPDLRVEQLIRKAARLELKLNPDGAAERRRRAKRESQRVEVRRELSGNMSLSAREMDSAQALASEAHVKAVAARLRRSGVFDGITLGSLRVLALADLTQGRDPLERITAARAAQAGQGTAPGTPPGAPEDIIPGPGHGPGPDDWPEPDDWPSPRGPAAPASAPQGAYAFGPAALPALVNLIIPAGILLGFSSAPGEAGPYGLLDRDEANDIARAAAAHPRTRWCVTLTAPDGTAIGHGCAHGQHPGLLDGLTPTDKPPPADHHPDGVAEPARARESHPPPEPRQGRERQQDRQQPERQQLLAELVRRLGLSITPVARGTCDHATAEDHYVPSRALKHLIRARSATCDFPGCGDPATQADLDHTVAWPDGPTDQCNLAPRCRTHHRAKQAPDWNVRQLAPGVSEWTMPSGRTRITTPTRYDT